MSRKVSAGLLLYRPGTTGPQVMLVHMGGPFWQHRDARAWSIPKGECESGESPLQAARREFAEETGLAPPAGAPAELGVFEQSSGKLLHAWALAAPQFDADAVVSNTFALEWPRGSGRVQEFPEIDRAGWFDLPSARELIVKGQLGLLEALERVMP